MAIFLAIAVPIGCWGVWQTYGLVLATSMTGANPERTVHVYKSPTCGCCSKWIALLEKQKIKSHVTNLESLTDIKDKYRIPIPLRSCHTAVINGYVFEGHVPIDLVEGVLKEQPPIVGLAVPGMPIGSPGMEVGGRKDSYVIVAFDRKGGQRVYARR
jgi:hypothetical protein